jgi:GYF domain 2
MSQVEWYYARDNRQVGPVSSAELKRLATLGELGPDDLVWREGMTEWAAARNVRGLFGEEGGEAALAAAGESAVKVGDSDSTVGRSPAKPQGASAARHPFDVLLDKFRLHFNARFLDATAAVFRACGSYGILAAMAVTAVFAIAMACEISSHNTKFADGTTWLTTLLSGVVLVLVLAALQYAAGKCCGAIDQLNREVNGRLSSSLVPDCFAMLSKVVGVAVLLGSVAVAIETSHYEMILFGVAAFFVCAYLTVVAMNPTALNISIAPETLAGEEVIGVFMFLLKALLRLTPVAFGAGVVFGAFAMGLACLEAFGGETLLPEALATAAAARHALFFSAALPLTAYLAFLLGNLVLNLWRSVLSLPGKLDVLAQKHDEQLERGQPDTVTTRD